MVVGITRRVWERQVTTDSKEGCVRSKRRGWTGHLGPTVEALAAGPRASLV